MRASVHSPANYLRARKNGTRPPTPWQQYEAAKNIYLASHPDATPAEYQVFIARLTRELGV